MLCKKDLVLFLFQNICFGYLLESPYWGDSNKYPKHMLLEVLMQYSCIVFHYLSSLEQRFRDIQIVIITNFVVVSNVAIKRADSIVKILSRNYRNWYNQFYPKCLDTSFYHNRPTFWTKTFSYPLIYLKLLLDW